MFQKTIGLALGLALTGFSAMAIADDATQAPSAPAAATAEAAAPATATTATHAHKHHVKHKAVAPQADKKSS